MELGRKINHFQGTTISGKKIFDLSYQNLNPNYFALGIHRHSIFYLLYEKVESLQIPIITGFIADEVKNKNNKYTLISKNNAQYKNYDLIIDASGANSIIRDKYAQIKSHKSLAYGALWGVCEDEKQRIGKNILQQKVHQAKIGIGLIPIGKTPHSDKEHIAFHLNIRNSDYEKWRNTAFAQWKDEIVGLWDITNGLLAQLKNHDDLTWAVYSDIALKQFYTDRIVFIGDAAHSISPRLGQGANLGLVDALVLSRLLTQNTDIDVALEKYNVARKNHVKFYHMVSQIMTRFFQSDSIIAPIIRDLSFGALCKIPFTHKQMLETLGGIRAGIFKKINPGLFHKDYDLTK